MRIIVEGLDGVGKTTAAKYIAEQEKIQYHKIKKTVKPIGTQEEITQAILDEMSQKLGNWRGVLDRGYLSTVATGMAYERALDYSHILEPANLVPDLGIVVMSDPALILQRSRELTLQDWTVLENGFAEVQEWLIAAGVERGYKLIENKGSHALFYEELEKLFPLI